MQITECLRLNTSLKKYLDISEGKFLNYFINFRMCNNYLPVEKGRLYKQDLINRKCRLCNLNEIGDEFHYLFKCHLFTDDRTTFISNRLCRNPNVYTYENIMNTKNKKILLALGKFFTKVLESVNIHLTDKLFYFFSLWSLSWET